MFEPAPPKSRHAEKWHIARQRRREGRPYKRIAAELGISPSTAYAWTRDIQLTPVQIERNRTGPGGPWNRDDIARRAYSWRRRSRNMRRAAQRRGRNRALEGDPLYLTGCILYWAEGSKNRNTLQFSNSELPMVRTFKSFAMECFDLEADRLTLSLNVYTNNGLSLEQIERYWLNGLGLPQACARKHRTNHYPTSSSGKRRNKLPHGVCTLTVLRSTLIVQEIFGAIQEYAGFEEPAWLD